MTLYSFRRAAMRLGVDRNILADLARANRIKTVPWLSRLKIPQSEIERIEREGVPDYQAPRQKRKAEPIPERIADLDI